MIPPTLALVSFLAATLLIAPSVERHARRSPAPMTERTFISVATLRSAARDAFTLLDARSASAYNRGHIPGAVRISWLDYRDSWGRTGRLPEDLGKLAKRLAALGISSSRAVVVYGDAHEGWGEEGRIAWMLRYLGHTQVHVLDGGYAAWQAAEGSVTRAAPPVEAGQFDLQTQPELRASADDVARARSRGAMVLDTRTEDEFNGSRRYFPARTGRIPGAVHLEWSDLLKADGELDRSPEAMRRLHRLGLTPDREIIAYCVGGVRSAFVVLALRELGFTNVRNYDGSWYEWSADRSRPVERP